MAERAWILFEVADTGIGISPEHLEQIFEPFRQLDGTSRRIHGGTGLGLAMVRRIIEQMDGAIHVDSEPGRGSTFRVALPMAIAAAPTDAPAPETAPLGDASPAAPESADVPAIRRVLIAEDNPVNQKLLDRILAKKGLEVVAVADGREALEAIGRESFDLILMDIQMPVMDGIEATRRIRELERSLGARRVPIIAVTANGMFQCREECASVGMDGYVVKPFGPANLFAAIDTVQRRVHGNSATDLPGSPTVSLGEDRCTGTGAPHPGSA
jgi:CheY-like chemotaxis protein